MTHDFKHATVELHGVNETRRIILPFGEKNIDVLIDRFADSVAEGRLHPLLPTFRDAATASDIAWKCLQDASRNDLPAIGTLQELDLIHERRRNMTEGYGLIKKRKTPVTASAGQDN